MVGKLQSRASDQGADLLIPCCLFFLGGISFLRRSFLQLEVRRRIPVAKEIRSLVLQYGDNWERQFTA